MRVMPPVLKFFDNHDWSSVSLTCFFDIFYIAQCGNFRAEESPSSRLCPTLIEWGWRTVYANPRSPVKICIVTLGQSRRCCPNINPTLTSLVLLLISLPLLTHLSITDVEVLRHNHQPCLFFHPVCDVIKAMTSHIVDNTSQSRSVLIKIIAWFVQELEAR